MLAMLLRVDTLLEGMHMLRDLCSVTLRMILLAYTC